MMKYLIRNINVSFDYEITAFFFLHCLKLNVFFRAKHIAGTNNQIANALSRVQMQCFRNLGPDTAQTGLEIRKFYGGYNQ